MEETLADVLAGGPEKVIFCEHAPVFTAGSSAEAGEVLNPGDIPVLTTGRGGKTTYHGPGQRVVYLVVRLEDRDIRAYIKRLQMWMVAVLADLGVKGEITDDVGVWVGEAKIAAIGVRVRKWVAYHGVALNVAPDLGAYARIRPCGLDKPVTSLAALGVVADMEAVDALLVKHAGLLLPPQSL
ncbi:MAG TPA: lipoyl(octanoyl) transferase LipB [Alphaproteobacteria bacterium]|nr:lipoyl(octanoyl) transferase LipB [Alphaproteobacteria bacterium]